MNVTLLVTVMLIWIMIQTVLMLLQLLTAAATTAAAADGNNDYGDDNDNVSVHDDRTEPKLKQKQNCLTFAHTVEPDV